ncbi:MAG: hypothetical protein QM754_19475 [Tepidisphaeraceae bacterium]
MLTQSNPTRDFIERQNAIVRAEQEVPEAQKQGREYVAPIIVQGQKLGTIRMTLGRTASPVEDATVNRLAEKFGVDQKAVKLLLRQLVANPSARGVCGAVRDDDRQHRRPALLPGVRAPPAVQRTDDDLQRHDDAHRAA